MTINDTATHLDLDPEELAGVCMALANDVTRLSERARVIEDRRDNPDNESIAKTLNAEVNSILEVRARRDAVLSKLRRVGRNRYAAKVCATAERL
jgi:hypothetical protein